MKTVGKNWWVLWDCACVIAIHCVTSCLLPLSLQISEYTSAFISKRVWVRSYEYGFSFIYKAQLNTITTLSLLDSLRQKICESRKLQSVTVTKTYDNIQLDRSFCKQFILYCNAEFKFKVILLALRKHCFDVMFIPIGYNSVQATGCFVVNLIC